MAAAIKNTKEVKNTPAVKNTRITLEGKIVGVSSPETIRRIALDKGISAQEVFVRVVFEYKGAQYTVSNKLKYITKNGYNELLEAKKNEANLKLNIDTESEFFYIEHDVSLDELFSDAQEAKTEHKNTLAALLV